MADISKEGTVGFQMHVPTNILFGRGKLATLHEQKMPGKKAMIVLSCGKSAKESGALSRTEEELKQAGVETALFDKIMANPLKSTVMEGASFARAHACDFIVALGGGSVMDAAKAIAAMATNPGDLWDYVYGGTGKGKPLAKEPLPIIAITTTAGTGSEVDQYGVITNEETKEKIGFGGPDSLFPKIAIVDPELMVGVPPDLTAYQGFDALFHSLECFIASNANIMSDLYALTAIEKIASYLPNAVSDGTDMEARENMAFANTLSGVVMTLSGCTSEHSLEHAMSAYHQDLPHGAGLIMISIAYFMHFIERHACDDRFVRMARALGRKTAQEPMDFIRMLLELQEKCGVAYLKMSDYGIKRDEFPMLARNARETMGGLFALDRVPLSEEDCIAIYEKAYR